MLANRAGLHSEQPARRARLVADRSRLLVRPTRLEHSAEPLPLDKGPRHGRQAVRLEVQLLGKLAAEDLASLRSALLPQSVLEVAWA